MSSPLKNSAGGWSRKCYSVGGYNPENFAILPMDGMVRPLPKFRG